MDYSQIVIIFFLLGLFTRTLLITYKSLDWKSLGFIVGYLILSYVVITLRSESSTAGVLFTTLSFPILIAIFLQKQLLTRISERTLLYFSVIYLYILGTDFFPFIINHYLIAILFSLPAFAAIILSFFDIKLHKGLKLFYYIWYIFLNIIFVITFLNLQVHDLSYKNLVKINLVESFFWGFSLFGFFINIAFLYHLIPLPSKNQSWDEKWKQVTELANNMIAKFHDSQTTVFESLFMIVITLNLLMFNDVFEFISEYNMILFVLIIFQLYEYLKHKQIDLYKPKSS